MRTVGLISLGCPKNLVDSEIMMGLLERAGYSLVQDPGKADIIIVNTCSFIEDAKKESIDTILEMAGYKKEKGGRCGRLVVTGCLPQRYKDELHELIPEVDLFVGTGEYQNIVKLLKGSSSKIGVPTYVHDSDTPRKLATPRHSVYVKIAEGCFHGCSFCIIPKVRGRFRSRHISDVVAESAKLIKGGARELNLIGQDTASYGMDLKNGTNLAGLLRELSKIPGDFWIRVMYAYPASITDELIRTVETLPKVCKYLDIPIQHINDKILALMKRKERGSDIRELVGRLRERMPGIALRTSLIVGFPGEGKKEFGDLLDFVKEGHFDHLGVFKYSREEGTFAARLKDGVSQRIKMERQREIMEVQRGISLRRNKALIGRTIKVLITGDSVGRGERHAPDIDGMIGIRANTRSTAPVPGIGDFARIKITGASAYDLRGEIC